MLSMQNMLSGTDEHGIRIRIFTSSLTCQRAQLGGFYEFTYEGGTIPSDEERRPQPNPGGVAAKKSHRRRPEMRPVAWPCGVWQEGLRLPGKHRHGHGEIRDESGNSYKGEWVNDKRSGVGTYTFACGDVYEGEWLGGKYHGKGKYTSADSDEYDGEWVEDKMSGHGKYRYRDSGDVYEGDWDGGFREGFGKYTCSDGTVYIGQYEVCGRSV